jgi:radical SAM protein with 4Fe4S-binding SPASM domain
MLFKKANAFKVLKNVYINRKQPVSIVHFVTNRCNARCSFCFIDFNNSETFKNELTLGEIEELTKNLGDTLLNINFTGGEPFARKDFLDIAKLYLKNTTVQSIYVTTNGSLPDRIIKFANEISNFDNKIEITFQISVDHLPQQHNKIRKIDNLFNNCSKIFHELKNMKKNNINPIICITVSEENCTSIKEIYDDFINKYNFNSIKCIAVRSEGVYSIDNKKKSEIFHAYKWLSEKIIEDNKKKKISNYNQKSVQGRLHITKDNISTNMVKKMYLKPKYISPCHASTLFGVIFPNGDLYPCEILENRKIGNLREVNMNFMKLWFSKNNKDLKNFILDSKCHCTYECALSYNILSNWRYQPALLKAALKFNNY